MPKARIICADVLEGLRMLESESVQCCACSPPYWGLRDYGEEGQIGLEKTPEEYTAKMVEVFREVRRVLRSDGVCFLNLGDSYAGGGRAGKDGVQKWGGIESGNQDRKYGAPVGVPLGLKPKDLVGIPWRVAFALQADGWWLRQDIIWNKPNPMPESVRDRPTCSHEYVFLLTRSQKYSWDQEAVRELMKAPEASTGEDVARALSRRRQTTPKMPAGWDSTPGRHGTIHGKGRNRKQDTIGKNTYSGFNERWNEAPRTGRNIRTVWTIPTQPFPEAHFATFPELLVEPMVKAGTSERGNCPKCGAPWERIVEKTTASMKSGSETNRSRGIPAGSKAEATKNRLTRRRSASTLPAHATSTRFLAPSLTPSWALAPRAWWL